MTELEVKGLAYEICHQSCPVNSVDCNDTERVLRGKSRIDGCRTEYTYGNCAEAGDNVKRFLLEANGAPADILIYIVMSEEDDNDAMAPVAGLIRKHTVEAPEQVYIMVVLGKSEDIRSGNFRLLIMAGYV